MHTSQKSCQTDNMERNAASDTTKGAAALDRVKKLRRIEPSLLPPCRPLPLLSVVCTARGPSAWNRTREPSTCKIKGKMLIHPHLASSWPITPNKSGRLRHSKKSSGGGKGLCLCCRSRALTSGATKPPGRRGCDDLCSTSRRGWFMAQEAYFLTCQSDVDATRPKTQTCGMPVR